MYYVIETPKSFEQASNDLDAAVKAHGFGVLHVHDLGATLRSKGIDFAEQCKVFEVCNPQQAAKVLSSDMRLNMALPCRISVFTEGGKTRIGLIRPAQLLADGGLAGSKAFLRYQANVLGMPVAVADDVDVTARGCAMLAGLGAGMLTLDDLGRMAPRRRLIVPDPACDYAAAHCAQWERARADFVAREHGMA